MMQTTNRHDVETATARVLSMLAVGIWLATATVELMAEGRHITYIEASTVHLWKLDQFPARTRTERYRFQVFREYDFDKSKVVGQVLATPPPLPAVVILQECSVYFPGDMPTYQRMYRTWVERLRERGLRPVIATVVPPAQSRGWWQASKDFVKQQVLRRPSRFEQVVAFNDWLRALGAELAVPVLDLELLLRVSAEDRHMRPEYDAGDGVHLTPRAYHRLDKDLLVFLDHLEWQRIAR
jgi:hypothetical protein